MIALIRRFFGVSCKYKSRILWAFLCAFLKGMMKAPIMLAFVAISEFVAGMVNASLCMAS